MRYKSLWLFLKVSTKSSFWPKRDRLSSHIVPGINVGNQFCTRNLRRNRVNTEYVQEKGSCELLVLLFMVLWNFLYIPKTGGRAMEVQQCHVAGV